MTEKTSQEIAVEDIAKEIVANEIDSASKTMEAAFVPEKIEEPKSDIDTKEVAVELIGTISAQPNPVYQGLAVSISYNVSNECK